MSTYPPADVPIRMGDIVVEMDRSRWSDTDQVGVRAKLRCDGALMDDNAIVSLVQNV